MDFGCNLPFSACLWRVLFCISTAHDPYSYFWSLEKVVALYVLPCARNSTSFNICLPGSFGFIVWSLFFTIKQCMSWTVNQLFTGVCYLMNCDLYRCEFHGWLSTEYQESDNHTWIVFSKCLASFFFFFKPVYCNCTHLRFISTKTVCIITSESVIHMWW